MCAILPVDAILPDEFDIRFIDERSRLQDVAGSLAAHISFGKAAQFCFDKRD